MSSAKVDSAGTIKMLDGRGEPDEVITEKDVQDPPKLARLLGTTLNAIAQLRRQWVPRRIDFEGIATGTIGATTVPMEHGFGGAIRWWVVGWVSSGGSGPSLEEATAVSTDTTLRLYSYAAGTATIRIEEAG